MTTPPSPGNGDPATPGAPAPAPSNPPAPEPKSDIERLRESKDKWKSEALAAKEEADRLRKEKQEAEEANLREKEDFKTLAEQKDAEAKAKAQEAEEARKRADDVEAKLKKIEEQQEAELKELLTTIPADKQPPLDPADPVEKRLQQVRYAASLLGSKKPDHINGPPRKQGDQTRDERKAELEKKKPSERTAEEDLELAELGE